MPRRTRWQAALAGLLAVACGALCAPAWGQDDAATLERRVKAAFLYKFVDYVDWPEGALARSDAPVTIGVLGDEALAAELAQIVAGRTAQGRPLAVRRVREGGEGLAGLQLLFVSRSESQRLGAVARASAGQPLLVVAESEGALTQGAAINFVVTAGKLRFDIALDAAERRGLKLSSRLLSVAQSVRSGPAS